MSQLNRLGTLSLLACIAVVATGCTSATSTAPTPAEPVTTTAGAAEDPGPTRLAPKGELVRVAHNNEGWITLGYRMANSSVGQDWMLIELGLTVIAAKNNQTLDRESISLSTPDGKTIPLASQVEFTQANLRSLDARANTVRDSINYFPVGSRGACRIGFFTDVSKRRGMAWDTVTVDYRTACLGRVYFEIPGGIQLGQHFLNVQFKEGLIRVPFKIMTKDELKEAVKEFDQMVKESKAQAKEQKK